MKKLASSVQREFQCHWRLDVVGLVGAIANKTTMQGGGVSSRPVIEARGEYTNGPIDALPIFVV